ncbi:hypothetical protein PV328_006039 [Microctonus aethiopoides]|uniref:Uncharacterized protein n=1 Tax=Microctonus aethiopoides TaxID=144406 RepID=A0AA39FNM8_9HYME|nr:hypothetical protein PV328_006039 [Microctonus aethiopoides]
MEKVTLVILTIKVLLQKFYTIVTAIYDESDLKSGDFKPFYKYATFFINMRVYNIHRKIIYTHFVHFAPRNLEIYKLYHLDQRDVSNLV